MTDLTLDEPGARSAQGDLHRLSAGVGLDLRQGLPDPGSPPVRDALTAWADWITADTTTLAARTWAAGDDAARAADLIVRTDQEVAARIRPGAMVPR